MIIIDIVEAILSLTVIQTSFIHELLLWKTYILNIDDRIYCKIKVALNYKTENHVPEYYFSQIVIYQLDSK